uniref:Trehalase n=1 Tax=Anisakis simplex TaxID=6269 RepID=A0A0M3KCT4_ANISI
LKTMHTNALFAYTSKHLPVITRKLGYSDDTLNAFNDRFGELSVEEIQKEDLTEFLDDYFLPPGSEMIPCTPSDWVPYPRKIMQITDPILRHWALDLNEIWKSLCKRIDPKIEKYESRYSLIYVPHEFIMPGGRFREFYYWDSYWIAKGLIASDMLNTTKLMIMNLAHIVEKYGFIPNGGRIYYLQRSQPPFLTGMVYEYFESTQDRDFLKQMLPILEKEFDFWQTQRTVNVTMKDRRQYTVYQYRTPSNVPRPESYREDTISARGKDRESRHKLWQDLASAAESGWDFSTRWLSDGKTLSQVETTRILPVDLNAFMCWNMNIMEYLYGLVGDLQNAVRFRDYRSTFRDAMNNVFYNKTLGAWFDYNMRTRSHNTEFYPSIAAPLFTGCYHLLNQQLSERVFQLMNNSGVFLYPGGVPTSLNRNSEEQWDFPNGFSPLNHMIIEGLRKSENAQMQDQYNVIGHYARPGAGGEYEVQDGFGWTNGVVLDLLTTYNDRMSVLGPGLDDKYSPFRPQTDFYFRDEPYHSDSRSSRSALNGASQQLNDLRSFTVFVLSILVASIFL